MLRADHEKIAFSRGLGVQMDATRRSQEADASALSSGNGAAVVVYPMSGTLPPHGEYRATITLVSNMPGEYFDVLRCRVGDLEERTLPIRAGVVGSPLIVQSTRQAPAGYAASHPRPAGVPVSLAWGAVPVGAPAGTKRFYCVNTGPRDMEVTFQPWVDPDPSFEEEGGGGGERGGEVRCAYTKMEIDEGTGTVSLHVTGGGVMCQDEGPFRVVPTGPVVIKANGGCEGFAVEYAYAVPGGKPRRFLGSVVGQHKLAGEGWDESKGLTLELGCAATKYRVGDLVTSTNTSAAAAAATAAAPTNPVRVRVDGGFHPSAGAPPKPMKPLVVGISADAFSPRLQPDAEANFAWVCHAPTDVLHSTYYRCVTLTNVWNTPVAFKLDVAKPFFVVEVESSVPQLGLENTSTLTRSPLFNSGGGGGGGGIKINKIPFVVPSRENIHVTMKFTPPEQDEDEDDEDGSIQCADYVADGALVVEYENEDVQTFPLVCEYIHPQITPSRPEVAFGKVHVNAPSLRTQRVVLTNDAEADAEWSVAPQLDDTGRGFGAFTFSPSSGVIKGRGRNGLPQSVTVEVTMSPKEEGMHEANVHFAVRMGRGCRVAFRGEGTWDETEEGKVMPRWDPLEEA